MPQPVVSVVFATFNRAHLLRRSLACYRRQHLPLDQLEIIAVDDDSTDDTAALLYDYGEFLNIKTIKLRKSPSVGWRDCAAVLNCGIRCAAANIVLITHPEVMVGRTTLTDAVEALTARPDVYYAGKPYYLSPADQAALDTVPWFEEGPLAVRKLPNFYEQHEAPDAPGHPPFKPRRVEAAETWESWVFGGFTRSTWRRLGGLEETPTWGTVDLNLLGRRAVLRIPTCSSKRESALCVHQNHDDPTTNVLTPRDLDLAHRAATAYRTPADAVCDYLW